MAQSVNPFDRKKQPVPQPVDPAKQAELMARASGAAAGGKGRTVIPTPPPAVKLPGITGNPPLPTGRPVGQYAPSGLTEIERQTLEAAGWTPDMPLPASDEGLKQLQQAVADQTSVEVPLPVDPRTPPLKVTTVPIEKLPAADQKRLQGALAGTLQAINAQEQEKKAQEKRQADMATREMAVKGITPAVGAAEAAVNAFREKMAKVTNTPVEDVPEVVPVNPAAVDAMKAQTHFAERAAQPAPEPPPAPEPTPHRHSELGVAGVTLTHCPHCSWDLATPDIPEPPHGDKIAFLHCMIGDKPYSKEVPLFGGNITVVFRTLTTREIDQVYKQAFKDRQDGKLPNELDYYERLNRYRLMLQLQAFRSEGAGGFNKDLPDGYSKSTNVHATGYWVTAEQEAELTPGETALPQIEEWMVDEVLKTENVFRTVNNACSQFNRLVAKMEAMADNSDFWRPTGEPS